MFFKGQTTKAKIIADEISILERAEISRQRELNSFSSSILKRAQELDRLVEEMKENRRGQNG